MTRDPWEDPEATVEVGGDSFCNWDQHRAGWTAGAWDRGDVAGLRVAGEERWGGKVGSQSLAQDTQRPSGSELAANWPGDLEEISLVAPLPALSRQGRAVPAPKGSGQGQRCVGGCGPGCGQEG